MLWLFPIWQIRKLRQRAFKQFAPKLSHPGLKMWGQELNPVLRSPKPVFLHHTELPPESCRTPRGLWEISSALWAELHSVTDKNPLRSLLSWQLTAQMSRKRNTSYLSRLSPAPDNTLLFYSGCQIFLARHLGLKSGKGGGTLPWFSWQWQPNCYINCWGGSRGTDYSQRTDNSHLTSSYEILSLTWS